MGRRYDVGLVVAIFDVFCNLYADDLILMSPSVCDLQKIVNLCVDEFSNCDMSRPINAYKSIYFGSAPDFPNSVLTSACSPVAYCDKTYTLVSCYVPLLNFQLICLI